ncbi:MAG: ABC transporter permease [Anaerotignaceae bacterium]
MDNSAMPNISSEQIAYLNGLRRRKRQIKLCQLFILVAFVATWELSARFGIIDAFIFSQPSRMLSAAIDMCISGSIFKHIGITVFETVLGFSMGTVMGTAMAVLLWWNSFVNEVSEPYLVVFNSLPKTALAPIIIVWLGNNMSSIIATALLTSVIVTVLNVSAGFADVDNEKIKLIYTFGGTKKQILTKVILPASVPAIINALKINVGLSFVGVIVGEFLVAKAGLGYLIVYGSQVFKLDWVMLSVVILAILAAFMYKTIVLLEKKIMKWRE